MHGGYLYQRRGLHRHGARPVIKFALFKWEGVVSALTHQPSF
jgi:hypothetical protein